MWADVMEHTRDGAADAIVETLGRVDVNRTAGILTSFMVNGVMRREPSANRDEGLPFVTHQMCAGVDRLTENPSGLGLGQILDHGGPSFTSGCADTHSRRPLHSHKRWSFQGFGSPFRPHPGGVRFISRRGLPPP